MYENFTVEGIKSDILGRMSSNIDIREGSFTNDMISSVAYELWKVYQSLDAVVPIAFVDETSGVYIDRRCSEYGITRKAGTKATALMNFTGTIGTVIPEGTVFLTSDGLQFETNETVTISGINGTGTVTATAIEIGESYNVEPGSIAFQLNSITGLSSLTNEEAVGGTDPESDSDLVARLYSFLKSSATSGNAAHYKQWALTIDGVGAAKVMPLWDGAGTVKVLVVGNDYEPVDSLIVTHVEDFIKVNRPIGASVTVASAASLPINVSAVVAIDSSTTIETVQTAFRNALSAYLKSIVFSKYTLLYNRISYMLLDIDGVTDFSSLTINGGTDNVIIDEEKVPVIGTVEVSIS